MVLSREVMYQVLYVGPEGMPEFVDLRATDEEGAQEEATGWSIGNASDLRQWGNAFVTLIKIVKKFGLPDTAPGP